MQDNNTYLTFDDGPDNYVTPKILDLLQKYDIKATFFLLGQKAEQHPDIVSDIQKRGHIIGNHSYSHLKMSGKSKQLIIHELTKADETLIEITGKKPRLFRPPHGRFGLNLLRVLKTTQHKMVLWYASVGDYNKGTTSEKIKNKLLKLAKPGQLILLHDGHRNSKYTLKALEESLDRLKDYGLNFSTIPKG
jgi:peptidoglycan/xylan/chitin deacetylase (PgdA/CDA1 family)